MKFNKISTDKWECEETGAWVKRSHGGWGLDFNWKSKRKWAAFFADGRSLNAKNGRIRTFSGKDEAIKAIETCFTN